MKNNKNHLTTNTAFFCILTLILVFIFYFHTLFYLPKVYDELAIFNETHVPVCFSLKEMLELISLLGLHQHFESSNTLYSNIVSLRCDPLCALLHLITQLLLQKNPFNYHLYSLSLHLINSALVFLIINKISLNFLTKAISSIKLPMISILTFLWATHPVNIESILLITNASLTLSYTFSFLTF